MRYTASSVKKELESISILEVHGGLGCPQDPNWTPNGNTSCSGEPASCRHAPKQTCKQTVEVRNHENGCKLCVLTFNFTISTINLDGFIDEYDQQLVRLVRMVKNGNYPMDTLKFVKC